jgi:HD-like signal output (HDOD) protein
MLRPESPTDCLMRQVITEIGSKGDFPVAGPVVTRLRTTVGREDCAALDVARIILQDSGTASKVLRLVNSAFYRKRGEPISTISRAVIVLGFEAIRDLTTGVVLMEALLRQGRSSTAIRDRLRRSLLCGLIAQRLAHQVGYPTAEEAYLLGLFSDWGLLWLAAYYPAEFEQARVLVREQGVSLDAAVQNVFGDQPAALSAAILEHWNLPAAFTDHFRHLPEPEGASLASPAAKLSAIVHVANDVAQVADAGPEAVELALRRAEGLLGLKREQLLACARAATEALREQAPLLGLGPVPPQIFGTVPSAAPAAGGLAADRHGSTTLPPSATARPGGPELSLDEARATVEIVAEVTRSMVEQRDINQILLMVLEGVARIGRFDAVFLALLNRQKDRIVGRLGYGEGVDEYLSGLSVPVAPGAGVLAEAILARTPQVLREASSTVLVPPGAPAPRIRVASLVACPLTVHQKTVGVLVATRAGGTAVAAADLPIVDLFCNQAAVVLYQYAR